MLIDLCAAHSLDIDIKWLRRSAGETERVSILLNLASRIISVAKANQALLARDNQRDTKRRPQHHDNNSTGIW